MMDSGFHSSAGIRIPNVLILGFSLLWIAVPVIEVRICVPYMLTWG